MTAASISFFSAIFKSAASGAIAVPRPSKADPPSTGGTSSLASRKSFSPRSCSTNSFPSIVPSAADFIESLFLREQTSRIIVHDFPLGLFFERERRGKSKCPCESSRACHWPAHGRKQRRAARTRRDRSWAKKPGERDGLSTRESRVSQGGPLRLRDRERTSDARSQKR